jgi:hypothetical protein
MKTFNMIALYSFAVMLIILATLVFADSNKKNEEAETDDNDVKNGGTFNNDNEAGYNLATLWRCYKKSNRKWSDEDSKTNWKDFVNNGVWKNDNAFKNWKRTKRGNAWSCETTISQTAKAVTLAEISNGLDATATQTEIDENLWALYQCFLASKGKWAPNANSGFGNLREWVQNGAWITDEDFRTWKEFYTGKFWKCGVTVPTSAPSPAPTDAPTETTTTTTTTTTTSPLPPDVTPGETQTVATNAPPVAGPGNNMFTTTTVRAPSTIVGDHGCTYYNTRLTGDALKIAVDNWCRLKYPTLVTRAPCELVKCVVIFLLEQWCRYG